MATSIQYVAIFIALLVHVCSSSYIESHGYKYIKPTEIDYAGSEQLKQYKAGKYPVYNETGIPVYIFDYRSSGNKYSKLLAGLALYNLGIVYNNSVLINIHNQSSKWTSAYCSFVVNITTPGHFQSDEMIILCEAMSSFIYKLQQLVDYNDPIVLKGGVKELIFRGEPVNLTGLTCSVYYYKESVEIPCDLLELYANQSLVESAVVSRNFSESHGYKYKPIEQIMYNGSLTEYMKYPPGRYPVYNKTEIPPYIFEYRSSGNKYSHILAGLALYNLGVVSNNSYMYEFHKIYISWVNTQCKFSVVNMDLNDDKVYEMDVNCGVITSFIYKNYSANIDQDSDVDSRPNREIKNITDQEFLGPAYYKDLEGLKCFVESRYPSSMFLLEEFPCDLMTLYAEKTLLAVVAKKNYLILLLIPAVFIVLIIALALFLKYRHKFAIYFARHR